MIAINVVIIFLVLIIAFIVAYLVGLAGQIAAMREHLASTAARADAVLATSPDVHQRLTSLERKYTGMARYLREIQKRPSRQNRDKKNAEHM